MEKGSQECHTDGRAGVIPVERGVHVGFARVVLAVSAVVDCGEDDVAFWGEKSGRTASLNWLSI